MQAFPGRAWGYDGLVIALSSFLLMAAVLVAEWRGAFARVRTAAEPWVVAARRPACFVAASIGLPVLFAAQLAIADRLAQAPIVKAAGPHLPIPVVDDIIGDFRVGSLSLRAYASAELLLLSVLESLALLCIAMHLRERVDRGRLALVLASSTVMAFLALAAHAMTSGDAYAYVAYALLPHDAYHPAPHAFGAGYRAINAWWGVPVPASVYGPLWNAGVVAALTSAPGLIGKLELLRVGGIIGMAALALLLGAGGFGDAVVALVILNPFLYEQYVVTPHNDLLPLLALVAAFVAARRAPPLAALGVAVAGLLKLPFLLIGLVTFARVPSRALRLGLAVATIGGVLVVSELWGGRPYLHAVTAVARHHTTRFAPLALLLAAIVGVAILNALRGRARPRGAMLAFPAIGALPYPWYAGWGLPYALLERTSTVLFLGTLPLVGALMSVTVYTVEYKLILIAALLVASLPLLRGRARPVEAICTTD